MQAGGNSGEWFVSRYFFHRTKNTHLHLSRVPGFVVVVVVVVVVVPRPRAEGSRRAVALVAMAAAARAAARVMGRGSLVMAEGIFQKAAVEMK